MIYESKSLGFFMYIKGQIKLKQIDNIDLHESWVDRPRDKNYKICKFKNTYTQDNKQLFQIIGQIHGAML